MWITEKLDKSKPLVEYLGKIVLDEDKNQAVVTRSWSGDRIRDKEKTYGQFSTFVRGFEELNKLGYSYHYENIVYGEPFFSFIGEFNKDGALTIIGGILN